MTLPLWRLALGSSFSVCSCIFLSEQWHASHLEKWMTNKPQLSCSNAPLNDSGVQVCITATKQETHPNLSVKEVRLQLTLVCSFLPSWQNFSKSSLMDLPNECCTNQMIKNKNATKLLHLRNEKLLDIIFPQLITPLYHTAVWWGEGWWKCQLRWLPGYRQSLALLYLVKKSSLIWISCWWQHSLGKDRSLQALGGRRICTKYSHHRNFIPLAFHFVL
jgi:hypothetical protein